MVDLVWFKYHILRENISDGVTSKLQTLTSFLYNAFLSNCIFSHEVIEIRSFKYRLLENENALLQGIHLIFTARNKKSTAVENSPVFIGAACMNTAVQIYQSHLF